MIVGVPCGADSWQILSAAGKIARAEKATTPSLSVRLVPLWSLVGTHFRRRQHLIVNNKGAIALAHHIDRNASGGLPYRHHAFHSLARPTRNFHGNHLRRSVSELDLAARGQSLVAGRSSNVLTARDGSLRGSNVEVEAICSLGRACAIWSADIGGLRTCGRRIHKSSQLVGRSGQGFLRLVPDDKLRLGPEILTRHGYHITIA